MEGGGLNREGGLINFFIIKGGLLERGGLFKGGGRKENTVITKFN